MPRFKTVLGDIRGELGVALAHEHICCYSEYAYQMAGKDYLDKEKLEAVAVSYLSWLKSKYSLSTFVDCTPVNIGRDVDLLKRVSERTQINIMCSTGFYYTDEPVLYSTSVDTLCAFMVSDAQAVNAAVIKCAVDDDTISDYQKKILQACAKAHLYTGLPIVLHTNAKNQNARHALDILLAQAVDPKAITAGHLSDTEDLEFVKEVASCGCFIGLDRLYEEVSEEYVSKKVQSIMELCRAGYEDQLLLSHDALFFNGFEAEPHILERPRFAYCFEHILPKLSETLSKKLMVSNPKKMLAGG